MKFLIDFFRFYELTIIVVKGKEVIFQLVLLLLYN